MEQINDALLYQQSLLNEAIEMANYDLSNPAVLAASMEYDRLTNEWMAI